MGEDIRDIKGPMTLPFEVEWWMVCLLIALVAAGAATILLLASKKRKGCYCSLRLFRQISKH